jgi:ribosomal protein L21
LVALNHGFSRREHLRRTAKGLEVPVVQASVPPFFEHIRSSESCPHFVIGKRKVTRQASSEPKPLLIDKARLEGVAKSGIDPAKCLKILESIMYQDSILGKHKSLNAPEILLTLAISDGDEIVEFLKSGTSPGDAALKAATKAARSAEFIENETLSWVLDNKEKFLSLIADVRKMLGSRPTPQALFDEMTCSAIIIFGEQHIVKKQDLQEVESMIFSTNKTIEMARFLLSKSARKSAKTLVAKALLAGLLHKVYYDTKTEQFYYQLKPKENSVESFFPSLSLEIKDSFVRLSVVSLIVSLAAINWDRAIYSYLRNLD